MTNYVIYQIEINNTVVYVGRTNNIDRREKEHRTGYIRCIKQLNNGGTMKQKQLYVWLYQNNIDPPQIALKPIDICKTKVESKRKEMFYILLYTYFKDTKLQQKIPGLKNY